jgi:Mrp family chromosome partitioning ATPase/uncharacterized protein involved in exopolysaccharide biosynthesis
MNPNTNSARPPGAPSSANSRYQRTASPALSRELAFRDLLELFSRSYHIIRARWVSGAIAAVLLGGIAAILLLRHPTDFTARTILFAQGTLDKVIGAQGQHTSEDTLGLQLENTLRNHLSVMEGRSFQSRLIASLSPAERAAVAAPYLSPGMPADDDFLHTLLESKIGVERERGREFFTIDVKHRSAATALMLASRFSNEYLELVQSQFRDANKEGFAMLETQAAALRKEIAKAEDDRLDFRKRNQIMSLADSQGILAERLKRVDAAQTDARILRIRLETELAQVQASQAVADFPWDNAYLANYGTNPSLHKDLEALTNQRAVLATRYGPAHPKMHDVDAAIAGITADIRHNFSVATQDLEIQLQEAQKTESDFQAVFDEGFGKSIETEKLASRSDIFATDIEVKRQNLVQLEKRIADAGLYSQLPVDFMQIADPAFIVRPRISVWAVKLALAAIIAFIAFCGTPLLMDLLDPRLKSTSDPEALLQLRLLGAIPVLKVRKPQQAHVVRDGVDLPSADAFSDVVGELDMVSNLPFPKVILVTSTLAGEGKSVLVSNLAAAYQKRLFRVVILDLDLRRPSQERLQSAGGSGGFTPWLRAGRPMENLLEPGGALGLQELPSGVSLIAAGGVERRANHHLSGSLLTALLAELRLRFDVILIDTPPAGLFQDALQLARQADERLLVARVACAPLSHIRKVIGDFDDAKAAFTGVILNGFVPRHADKALAYVYRGGRNAYYHPERAAAAQPSREPAARAATPTAAATAPDRSNPGLDPVRFPNRGTP